LFREIAWLGASGGAVFDQGVGRWLGLLADPERFTLVEAPSSIRHLARAVRHLLQSSATLAPALALPGFDDALPRAGGPGYASGTIHGEFMAWTEQLLSGDPWPLKPLASELFGREAAEHWRDVTRRAVKNALRRGGHLLEVDSSVLRARVVPERRRDSDIRELRPALHAARVA
jgi:hypothetical protein